jgi:hypothetical protein
MNRMAASNNGIHPTRNSAALKLNVVGGRVMPGVRLLVDRSNKTY